MSFWQKASILLRKFFLVFDDPRLEQGFVESRRARYLAPLVGVPSAQSKDSVEAHALDEGFFALMLDMVVTVTHFFVPMRFKYIWAIEVSAIFSYVVPAIVFDAPIPTLTAYNMIALTALFFSSGLSHRTKEAEERKVFNQLASERELRYRFQFELEASKDQGNTKKRRTADELSVATTTDTDVLWGKLANHGLQELAEIGYKEHWLIPSKAVVLNEPLKVLGAGSFGMVVAATYFQAPVAVKMTKQRNGVDLDKLLSTAQELRILRQVRHPYIVSLHGACVDPKTSEVALVLERLEGMPLSEYLRKPGALVPHMVRRKLMKEVAGALQFLHAHYPRIVHGDLKGSNVLAEPGLDMPFAKLIDFGLARLITRSTKPLGGTPKYAAPEVLMGHHQGFVQPKPSADAFSFGRLLYLAATGRLPLSNWTMDDIMQSAYNQEVPKLDWPGDVACSRPDRRSCPVQQHQLEEYKALSDRCLVIKEQDRLSMDQVLEIMDLWDAGHSHQTSSQSSTADDSSSNGWPGSGSGTGSYPSSSLAGARPLHKPPASAILEAADPAPPPSSAPVPAAAAAAAAALSAMVEEDPSDPESPAAHRPETPPGHVSSLISSSENSRPQLVLPKIAPPARPLPLFEGLSSARQNFDEGSLPSPQIPAVSPSTTSQESTEASLLALISSLLLGKPHGSYEKQGLQQQLLSHEAGDANSKLCSNNKSNSSKRNSSNGSSNNSGS